MLVPRSAAPSPVRANVIVAFTGIRFGEILRWGIPPARSRGNFIGTDVTGQWRSTSETDREST
jgi:hypothetical protein